MKYAAVQAAFGPATSSSQICNYLARREGESFMKRFSILFIVAFFFGMIHSTAFADSMDYHLVVLDPPIPNNPIFSTSFSFSFVPCQQGELPTGVTAEGCFEGTNDSGQAWKSLQLTFAATDGIAPGTGQTADCSPAPTNNFFSNANCPANPVNGLFVLTFTGGSIPSGEGPSSTFLIAEDGVDPAAFPTGNALANAPEPSSYLLMLTGTLFLGFICSPKLRQIIHG